MHWKSDGEYQELFDEDLKIAAYGPNPYGMMGQDWTRAWFFQDNGKLAATSVMRDPAKAREWCLKRADARKNPVVYGVFLIPAEGDPLGLLAEGPCGSRPPCGWQWDSGPWRPCKGGLAAEDTFMQRTALALAWERKPVDAAEHWLPGEAHGSWRKGIVSILEDGFKSAGVSAYGTLVMVDEHGREVARV